MTLKREWSAIDSSKAKDPRHHTVSIPPGRHEVERVPNPFGFDAPWLVLKGTLIGATEGSWKEWVGEHLVTNKEHPDFGKRVTYGEFEIVIEEE